MSLKGFRDMSGDTLTSVARICSHCDFVGMNFGFMAMQTPALERTADILGENPSPDQLEGTFSFTSPDGEELSLRYDQTMPLVRYLKETPNLPQIFKRRQMGTVWRNDKAANNRFREFNQFDLDTVGSTSIDADAEIVAALYGIVARMQLRVEIRINNRKVLAGFFESIGLQEEQFNGVCRVLDKLDKHGRERVVAELGEGVKDSSGAWVKGLGLDPQIIAMIDDLVIQGTLSVPFSDLMEEGLTELNSLYDKLIVYGIPADNIVISTSLARGLNYYTGTIFELVSPTHPEIGAVGGGGRYDNLMPGKPAVGGALGIERLHMLALAEEDNFFGKGYPNDANIFVAVLEPSRMSEYLALVHYLRSEGQAVDIWTGGPAGLSKQLKYANAIGAEAAVIIGEDEFKSGTATIKNLELGKILAKQTENREEWLKQPAQSTVPLTNHDILREVGEINHRNWKLKEGEDD